MSYRPVDLSRVTTYPLAQRRNKVTVERDFAAGVRRGMSVTDLLGTLPRQLGAESLLGVVAAVVRARELGKPVIFGMGAHVLKCGLQPVIRSLIEAGAVTAVAMNGAGSVHDYEISLIGATSEDVGAVLHEGTFGMAEETGADLWEALRRAVVAGCGYGEGVGRYILERNNPFREWSLLALCARQGIPATVHAAVGTDIIHQHPAADGAILGEATFTDFRLFTDIVANLGNGGVYLNVGSAVLMPEVFLKALSIAQNLSGGIEGFTTANFDMVQHYRPLQNVVKRPSSGHGCGYTITGQHEIMIPLLAAAILDRIG